MIERHLLAKPRCKDVATNLFYQIFDLGGTRFGAVQRKVYSPIYLKLLEFPRSLTKKIGATPKPSSPHRRMSIGLIREVDKAIGLHNVNRTQWNTQNDVSIEGI